MPHRIIVAGIYRSGTSLTTELIHRWGAYAGQKSDIFEDEYGYMEHFALQKINDDLLNNTSRVPTPVDQLLKKAQEAAEKVRRWGDVVELEPLNAFDRRIVHHALKDDPDITTQSVEVDGTNKKAILLRPRTQA